mmetsp:Transcript_8514/g.28038  ORF Transcript_8514/g.28038 Transcript_8514/m.28038 type:complete len:122 (-) Transcript_8514:844-1209(-)
MGLEATSRRPRDDPRDSTQDGLETAPRQSRNSPCDGLSMAWRLPGDGLETVLETAPRWPLDGLLNISDVPEDGLETGLSLSKTVPTNVLFDGPQEMSSSTARRLSSATPREYGTARRFLAL